MGAVPSAAPAAEAVGVGGLNEYGAIRRMALRHPRDAYLSQARLDAVWLAEEFVAAPDYAAALAEYDRFTAAIEAAGVPLEFMPADDRDGISAIYARDSAIVAPGGVILCNMANAYRAPEPAVVGDYFAAAGVPVVGAITGDGLLEGGDFVWFDATTCAVAQGYRTNAEGIRQLKDLLGPAVHVEVVPLPHHRGPRECLHLMSLISPLDDDLAAVYSPLMPVPFRDWLIARGIALVEVPDAEFDPSMGCNVLALSPRRCLVIEGNPVTRARLEAAGCAVVAYQGAEISIKGCGGPTCLTRPLARD